jgi:hypothetical protein
MDPETFDPDGRFRREIAESKARDPMHSLRALAANLNVPEDDVVHYALSRWAAAGSEALLSGPPEVFLRLREAAAAGDLDAVRGIVDFLMAGWENPPTS